jgi:DNA polymerase V
VSLPDPAPDRAGPSGFPSPADDYVEARIDLNVVLIPRPLATFLLRVSGEAMRGDGIGDGDLLVIDRSLQARPGLVVVAVHEGVFLLRRLQRRGDRLWLVASDGGSAPIPLRSDPEEGPDGAWVGLQDAGFEPAEIWGVVRHAVHLLLPPVAHGTSLSRGVPGAGR